MLLGYTTVQYSFVAPVWDVGRFKATPAVVFVFASCTVAHTLVFDQFFPR